MPPVAPLQPDQLYRRTDPAAFDFTTTAELPDLEGFIGQDRAIDALRFGVKIERHGYNIYALGPTGTGRYTLVRRFAEERAAGEPPPSDWCYVNNFEVPSQPRALRLPPGMGKQLRHDMERLVEDLRTALSAAFESEEYQNRRQTLEAEFQERQQESLNELQERARERNLALLRTQGGLVFAPLHEGNVLEPEEFEKLSDEEKERIKSEVEVMQEQLQKMLYQAPRWEREFRSRFSELNEEVTGFVLADLMNDLRQKYVELPDVTTYLDAVKKDVSDNVAAFLRSSEHGEGTEASVPAALRAAEAMRRYKVNVLVDSEDAAGAPVVYENNPTYLNLVGRVEQMAQLGALLTDFMLIKPGVLHYANGGYLILDAMKVLSNPYAWEGLKRALQFHEIRLESPLQMMSLTSTVSLEPEPIPLDVKVALIGDRQLYYLLAAYDPDFEELFKVAVDFDDEIVRDEGNQKLYAQLIATTARREGLRPFDAPAVQRVIEHSARMVSDAERLSARLHTVVDLLEEADHWTAEAGAEVVGREHVQKAIDAQVRRQNRVQERMQEEVVRNTIFIDTSGEKVGQVNALSVIQLGGYAFGRPSRITATVRLGQGEVVDIEREVEMGGPLHSKGVLILSSFLRARYADDEPLSLGVSLVFEQSYGGVEGDSASSTELYAILSAISGAPVKQSLAVTGSVNQFGQVQAIGGVNEKIEGFFDLCKARGLTGEQGVLIPAANVKHLMLRQDIVDAVAAGQFAVYPVETIDQGIELLTGVPAGERDAHGSYPAESINRRVEERLAELTKKRIEFDKLLDDQGKEKKTKSRKKPA